MNKYVLQNNFLLLLVYFSVITLVTKAPHKTLIFPTILNKVNIFWLDKWGYEGPQSNSPDKFQVPCGYWAMTKAYTAPIIGFLFEMTTMI